MTAITMPHQQHHHFSPHQTPSKSCVSHIPGIISLPCRIASPFNKRSVHSTRIRQSSQPLPSSHTSLRRTTPIDPPCTLQFRTALPVSTSRSDSKALRRSGLSSRHTRNLKELSQRGHTAPSTPSNGHDDHCQSDSNPLSARKSRSTKTKNRPRARSVSPPPAPQLSPTDYASQPTNRPPRPSGRRSRTITLESEQASLARPNQSKVDNPFVDSVSQLSRKTPKGKKNHPKPSSTKKLPKSQIKHSRQRAHSLGEGDDGTSLDPYALDLDSRSSTPTPSSPRPDPSGLRVPFSTTWRDISRLSISIPDTLETLCSPKLATAGPTPCPRPRAHARARSVASILTSDSVACDSLPGPGKPQWTMPKSTGVTKPLTWQQRQKAPKCFDLHTTGRGHLGQKLALHDRTAQAPQSADARPSASERQNKETHPARRQRTVLSRTPSAGCLSLGAPKYGKSRLTQVESCPLPSISVPSSPTPAQLSPDTAGHGHLSKPTPAWHIPAGSDSALTWQQTIMKSSPPQGNLAAIKPVALSGTGKDHELVKKSSTVHPAPLKTPIKPALTFQRPTAQSACRQAPVCVNKSNLSKRRNSMSSGPDSGAGSVGTSTGQLASPMYQGAVIPMEVRYSVLKGQQSFNRRSTPLPTTSFKNSTPFPLTHAKSEPAPAAASITLNDIKFRGKMTPSKSKSTSELLQLLTPAGRPGNVSAGNAAMYAGPQFHNSPSPAALPPLKFALGS